MQESTCWFPSHAMILSFLLPFFRHTWARERERERTLVWTTWIRPSNWGKETVQGQRSGCLAFFLLLPTKKNVLRQRRNCCSRIYVALKKALHPVCIGRKGVLLPEKQVYIWARKKHCVKIREEDNTVACHTTISERSCKDSLTTVMVAAGDTV